MKMKRNKVVKVNTKEFMEDKKILVSTVIVVLAFLLSNVVYFLGKFQLKTAIIVDCEILVGFIIYLTIYLSKLKSNLNNEDGESNEPIL